MSAEGITDELVRQVAGDLRQRYALDDEDVRRLGARLAAGHGALAECFVAEEFTARHRETFDRLAQ